MTAFDYVALLGTLFAGREVRDPVTAHPDIMIWGTLEARVQGADLVIAAGLNEGVWPKSPDPDPWLNRAMRAQVGLLLPDRQIGLSAHDYQQAVCAPPRGAVARETHRRGADRSLALVEPLDQPAGRFARSRGGSGVERNAWAWPALAG